MTEKEVEKRRDRDYIRSYTRDWLMNGITAYLTESQQAVWNKLQHLAGGGDPPGTIRLYPDQVDPYTEIASSIHSKPTRVKDTLEKLQRRGKVTIQDNLIHITNWEKEQPQIQTRFPGKEWEGTGEKRRGTRSDTPRDYKAGELGHMVATTAEDLARIKAIRETTRTENQDPA